MADVEASTTTLARQRGWQAQLGEIRSPSRPQDVLPDDAPGVASASEASAQARLLQSQNAARQRQQQEQMSLRNQAQEASAEAREEQADELGEMAQQLGQQEAQSAISRTLDKMSERSQMMFGAMIKTLWSTLWMTLGHTIYVIDIFFAVGFVLNVIFGRRVVPEVGGEWIPPIPETPGMSIGGADQSMKRIRERLLFMIKIGEFFALGIITALVVLLDVVILFFIALIIEVVRGAKDIF